MTTPIDHPAPSPEDQPLEELEALLASLDQEVSTEVVDLLHAEAELASWRELLDPTDAELLAAQAYLEAEAALVAKLEATLTPPA